MEIMARGRGKTARSLLADVLKEIQFDDVCNIQFTSVSKY